MLNRLRSTLRQTFHALRTRNFRLFFIGQSISNTGNWLTNVALILLILHLTHSGFAIGLLAACQYGPILLLSIYAGVIADRYSKRKLLFLTQGLEMLESIALAVLAFTHNPPISAFYVIATFGGILLAFDNPLRRSFVSEMVPKTDIPNAVILYSTIVNVARIIGPPLAGVLIVVFGYGWAFSVDALSYLAVLVCLWMMRPSELHLAPLKLRTKGEIRKGFKYILSMPVLWITFIMLALVGGLAYNFTITLPLFVTKSLHGSNADFTLLYSFFGFGSLVSALFIANRGLVKMRHVIIGAVSVGVTMIVLTFCPSLTLAIPIVFLLGLATILYMTATTTIMQVESEPSMIGRVLALQAVLFIGLTPIVGPFLGWIADTLGARIPIFIGGFACLVAGMFGYMTSKKFKNFGKSEEAT
ncbi:MAG TPA: MFS transporter [Candidatus Dormibacteraeota bacterium]|nr:MFS transporter [Candidatus Dormibacteraeota bacterium]